MSLIGSGDSDLPVMVQTSFVQTELGNTKICAMWDLCSTDHYILNKAAKKLNLEGVEVKLLIEEIKGKEHHETTRLYDVPLVDKSGKTVVIL